MSNTNTSREALLAGDPAEDGTFTENPIPEVDRPFWRSMVPRRALEAHDARKQFDLPPPSDGTKNPIFTFNRYLATATHVPDGRTIYIGGQ